MLYGFTFHLKLLTLPIVANLDPLPEFLDLSRNDFSSSLSPEFAKLTNLHTLVLNELSALTGSLPDALANLTNMKDLQLHQTQVTGRIFDFAASWPKLEVLDIGQAHVTGTLPTTIGISNKNLKSL